MDSLCKLTTNPERLPSASEQVIEDAKIGYNLMSESIYGYHVRSSLSRWVRNSESYECTPSVYSLTRPLFVAEPAEFSW